MTPGLAELARKVSNWGRWGADDERGTINFITPEVVQRAARCVRRGDVFSLGLEFGPGGELGNLRRALSRKEVENCFRDRRVRLWGADGSAGDVTLPCAAYWEQYVFDRDFSASANIAYNEHPSYTHDVGSAFSPQPDEAFVEYYLPPDPDKSLRASALTLVFSPIGRAWKLTGIVHAAESLSESE